MTPTPRLRFVERNDRVVLNGEEFDNWQRVLQQWWEPRWVEGTLGVPHGEWRDVPLEKENV
jgi:hypothetical protein